MVLPNNYTQKPGAIPTYFDAILNAEAPERFTNKFLVNLEFKSTNDRLFIGILKDLKFLDTDGIPKERYYQFHDRNQSRTILAQAIRETFSDLFEVNKSANTLTADEVKNKLRTLYAGSKSDNIITKIASTFTSLCEYADFSNPRKKEPLSKIKKEEIQEKKEIEPNRNIKTNQTPKVTLDSLQYHINIVLPESRDQAVYDAIFKSLRNHLG